VTARIAGTVLGFGVALLALAASSAAAQEKLVVGYSNLQSSKIPLPIARDAGLFAKRGLDVELVRVTPGNTAVPKLLAGEIQIFVGNGDPVAKAAAKDGAKLTLIASLGEDSFQLVARKDIRDAAALKGKRVGISKPGSTADRVARATLTAMGLNPDSDVQITATNLNNSRARLDLLLQGGIDATIVDVENVKALGERGADVATVADLSQLGIFISGADISTTRDLIASRRDTVSRFLAALVEAIALAKKDPEIARQAYAKYGEITDKNVLDWRVNEFLPARIPPIPYPNPKAIAAYLKDVGSRAAAQDVADSSLLREIASAGAR